MDWAMLILTLIGTGAAAISAVIAVRAKKEAQNILIQIKDARSISSSIVNSGSNKGTIAGIVNGDIDEYKR